MKKGKNDTKNTIVIVILVILVLGLSIFIATDKLSTKEKNTASTNTTNKNSEKNVTNDDNTNTTNKKEEHNENTNNNSIPTENEIKELMIKYIKENYPSAVDYRINNISLENNTKELKEMINENQENILANIDFELIREGNGYTKSQGWIKINQSNCILVKNTSGSYYVSKCGSGW